MTLKNYDYRTSPFLQSNQVPGEGKLQISVVLKFQIHNSDFDDLRFIGFDRTNLENSNHRDRMVHFFLYDYKFKRVWKTPDADLEKLRQYRAVLTPDFGMYLDMSPVMKLYNVFRNRWCGAFWASKGPTVSWGGEDTFEYCFDGIKKGSTVAVSTYMATAHSNHSEQKDFSQSRGRRGGHPRDTKIGEDGRAERERHNTNHDSPGKHSSPHDHEMDWSKGLPDPGNPINYSGGTPGFKGYERRYTMSDVIGPNSLEENCFKTISDFKWCVTHGGGVELEYRDKVYGIFPKLKQAPDSPLQILLIQKFVENQTETERWYDTADDLLEYQIDGIRLRDVITAVSVYDSTI